MSRPRAGERVKGPYPERGGWRVIEYAADGSKTSTLFDTEAKADRYVELVRAELETVEYTTETALDLYKSLLESKGNKPDSVRQTMWALRSFFPEPIPLALLSPKRCQALYDDLRVRPMPKTKKPLSVDSHRGFLAQARSLASWCVSQGWLRENPLADVHGVGKRRPRGKSLGKAGNELRIREARQWYGFALFKASRGDQGATAALVALLLGMRASEITTRKVADLDTDEADGDLLWIPCSKTPAGRRTIEVPEVLRPLLVACCEGKTPDRHIFEAQRTDKERELHKPHQRGWIKDQVHRICDLAGVPRVTAHAMRGLLSTITAQRGLAGHLIAETLGHADESTTFEAYAAPGAKQAGVNRRGLRVLNGGVQVRPKSAK